MIGTLPQWVMPAVIGSAFALLAMVESLWPLRHPVESRLRRTSRNLTTGAISLACVTLVQTAILVPVSRWLAGQHFGLLHVIPLPRAWATVAAVLLLDYTLWIWHWANHRVPFLWRFHLVHHVDLDLDASTAFRFHFGEQLLSIPARAVQIAIIGAAPLAVGLWQAILFVSILFHHSNLRLPLRVEALLVRFVVTPRMHGIHHAAVRDRTDSNWSSILTVWDFLHRTFRFDVPDEAIAIGVPAYQRPEDVTLPAILTMPFRPQRRDWSS